jgi:predicted DNA-binding transcriptional regulator YafY
MARGDQLSRQWKIIHSLLASVQGKSAGELADDLECHSRTVYRDLEALQMAGFPLYNAHKDGRTCWSILDADRHQMPLPLNLTELMALYFSRNMLKVLQGTAIFDSLTNLFDKVKATLPPEYIAYLDKLSSSLDVGFKAYKPYQRFQNLLTQVNEAAQEQRHIDIEYFSMSRQVLTHRRVAPYKVWFYDETFYVIGFCGLRQAVRLFAVDRIAKLQVSDDLFELPQGFDANEFMQASFGIFQGESVQVRIRFAPAVAGYISEKIWHPTQTIVTQQDGSVLFSAEVAGIEEIKHWVLKWGAGAIVMAPASLRQAVIAEIGRMAVNYDE